MKKGAPGLAGMSNDEMKALLRLHGQSASGDRATLGQRIVDYHLPIPGVASTSSSIIPSEINYLSDGTEVVNVKQKFLSESKYADIEAWCEDRDHNVYIGRQGQVRLKTSDGVKLYPPESKWKNPYSTKKHGAEAVPLYEAYIRTVPFLDEIEELRGKKLGCWCVDPSDPSIRCHGQVLLKILQERNPSTEVIGDSGVQPYFKGRSLPPPPNIPALPPIYGLLTHTK